MSNARSVAHFEGLCWLCCTNPVRDSSCESSVVAGWHEQTHTPCLQDQKLACLQRGAQAPRVADDPLAGRRLSAIAVRLVRSRHDLGGRADGQAWPPPGLQ
jgi:hypothetical protein